MSVERSETVRAYTAASLIVFSEYNCHERPDSTLNKVKYFELSFDSRTAACTPCCSSTASFLLQTTPHFLQRAIRQRSLRSETSAVMPMPLSPHSETTRKFSYRKGNLAGQWSPLTSSNHCSSCPNPAGRPFCEVKLLSEVFPSGSEHHMKQLATALDTDKHTEHKQHQQMDN